MGGWIILKELGATWMESFGVESFTGCKATGSGSDFLDYWGAFLHSCFRALGVVLWKEQRVSSMESECPEQMKSIEGGE